MEALRLFCLVFLLGSFCSQATAEPVDDKLALLEFVNQLPHSRYLNWNSSTSVCNNWIGVTCSADGSRIVAVRLPGVGFQGQIPANTLSRLTALQILSLRSNGIYGPFPSDFSNLRNLSYLYLQFNKFSGPLPFDFTVWKNLTIVNFANNAFNGSIPYSISNLTELVALNLANNSLSGKIPELSVAKLQQLNLSNNKLTGIVPMPLLRFSSSAFNGNNVSFINFPPQIPPRSQTYRKPKYFGRLGEMTLMGIIVAACVLGIVAFSLLLLVFCSRKKRESRFPGDFQKGERSPEKGISGSRDANNKMVFFEGCNYVFDLEDLLRASAEVLGKGVFGTAYKAILEDATAVVVKRLKEVSVGKREFEQQMEIIGKIKHENVVELRAYYYSKDEKLMVCDYYSQGSVSSILHGKRGEERVPLDWDTRLRIAIGAARGLAYIHSENNSKLVHGNVKSSNIFLNSHRYGCVSDLGLATVMSPLPPPIARSAGYRAPEITDTRKASQPSDVYSYGVLLLELLTGKSPVHTVGGDEVVHLVRWVHSVVREEWTAEVFDVELIRIPNKEEELVEMLQIAMGCVVRVPDQRPKMQDVLKMVENIRPMETDTRSSL